MTTSTGQRADLSDRVAEEIRALLARRRMSGAALARHLNVSPMWVSYRLNGRQPIDLDDLQRIAAALGVSIGALFPAETLEKIAGTPMVRYAEVSRSAPRSASRPPDNRPSARPSSGGHGPDRRTVRLPRPGGRDGA